MAMVYMFGRRLVITTKGYLAVVPPLTEPGDIVCLIMGSPVPFLLRSRGKPGFEG